MKHIYPILASITLLASIDSMAQSTLRMPKPVHEVKVQHCTTTKIPGVRLLTQAELARAAAETQEMVKKMLVTKIETSNSYGENVTCTVTYNNYGHFKTLDYGSYKMQYDYVYGYGNHWTAKTVTMVGEGFTEVKSKEIRTLDEQGRVTSIKLYEPNNDKLMLKSEKAYEYAHNAGGMLVKNIIYRDYDGSVDRVLLRKWFDKAKTYVEVEYNGNYEKKDINIGSDYYEINNYNYNSTDFELESSTRYFYTSDGIACGELNKTYSNGETISQSGWKEEYLHNTPQKGYTTVVYYRLDQNSNYEWKKEEKREKTDNYDDPLIPSTSGFRSYKYYSYDDTNEQWTLSEEFTKEWTPQGYLKEAETYINEYGNNTDISYTMYSDNGEETVGSVFPFKNGAYVVNNEEDEKVNGNWIEYYTFYDATGKQTRKIKKEYTDHYGSYTAFEPRSHYYELKNGTWQKLTGKLSIGDCENRLELTFNEQGKLSEWTEYEGGNIEERYVYEYTASSYTETHYEKDGNGGLQKSYTTNVTRDDSGNITCMEYEYEGSDTKFIVDKYITYTNGKFETYTWDDTQNVFRLSSVSANDLVYTDDQGVETTIQRQYDSEKNAIIETYKHETYKDDKHYWDAYYNKVDGKWVGQNKNEEVYSSVPVFKTNTLQEPLTANDEYFSYTDNNDNTVDVLQESVSVNNTYYWKDDKWNIEKKYGREYILDGDKLTEKQYDIYDGNGNYHENVYTTETTRNADNNIIECRNTETYIVKEPDYDNGNDGSTLKTTQNTLQETIKTYTYDSEQRITKEVNEKYETDNTAQTPQRVLTEQETVVYYYGEVDVMNAIDKVNTNAIRPTFAVSGRNISLIAASSATEMSLYSLDGQLIATSTNGQLTAPTNGLYIVKAGSKKAKIIVK